MRWPRPRHADAGGGRRVELGRAAGVGLLGLLLALFGLALAGETVAVPGLGLLLLGLLALLVPGLLALGTRVEQRRVAATVVEGQRVAISVRVRAPRLLSRGWGSIVVPGLAESLPLRGGLQRVELELVAPRRGPLALPAPAVCLSDPLGLARIWRRSPDPPEDVFVLPRTETVRWRGGAALVGSAALRRSRPRGDGAHDPDGLREYTAGTPATRIFWPALARGGELLERTFTGEADEVPLLVLDPRCSLPQEEPELDAVVRATASLVLELAARGEVDLLLPDAGAPVRMGPSLATWPGLWRRLALCAAAPPGSADPVLPPGIPGTLILAAVHPRPASGAARALPRTVLTLGPARDGSTSHGSGALAQVAGCELAPAGWGR